jgi:hypothetical protein
MKVVYFHEDGSLRLAGVEQLLFALWSDAPRIDQLQHLARAAREHLALIGERKQVLVNVMLAGTPNFSDEVRRESAALAKRFAARRIAVAHVILAPGFIGVAARAFISTLILVARPTAPTKVFDSLEAAATWLVPYLDGTFTKDRLVSAYNACRRS